MTRTRQQTAGQYPIRGADSRQTAERYPIRGADPAPPDRPSANPPLLKKDRRTARARILCKSGRRHAAVLLFCIQLWNTLRIIACCAFAVLTIAPMSLPAEMN